MTIFVAILDQGYDGETVLDINKTPEGAMAACEEKSGVNPIYWRVDAEGDFVQADMVMSGFYTMHREVSP